MQKETITVLMTVYNGCRTIRRAIESILAQTYSDFVFLIVDDCSTDNTIQIIRSYPDSRITLHQNSKNIGQTKSLNVGINLISAPYIARMDVDDFSFPARLEKQYEYILRHPEYVVVGTDCCVIDEHSQKKRISNGCIKEGEILLTMLHGSPINHASVLMKTDAIKNIGGYRSEYLIAADFDLWSRLIRSGYKITTLPKVLMTYTVSGNSYSSIHAQKKNEEVARIVYENIQHLSSCHVTLESVQKVMQLFYGDIHHLSENDVYFAEQQFSNIVTEVSKKFRGKVERVQIKKVLRKNYWISAYHLLLEGKSLDARALIRRCLASHGLDFSTFCIYLATYISSFRLRKINYLRSRYFS